MKSLGLAIAVGLTMLAGCTPMEVTPATVTQTVTATVTATATTTTTRPPTTTKTPTFATPAKPMISDEFTLLPSYKFNPVFYQGDNLVPMSQSPIMVYPFTITNRSAIGIRGRYRVKVTDAQGVIVKVYDVEVRGIHPGETYWTTAFSEKETQKVEISQLPSVEQRPLIEVTGFRISDQVAIPGRKGNFSFTITNTSMDATTIGFIEIRAYDQVGRLVSVSGAHASGNYGVKAFQQGETRAFSGGLNRDGYVDICGLDIEKVTYKVRLLDSDP